MKNTITILILVFSLGLSSQTKLDSLYEIWEDRTQPDSSRVLAYKDFIWEGFMFSQPDTAYKLADKLYDFADRKEYLNAKAQGLYIQGVSLHLRGLYLESLAYYQNCLELFEELNDQEGIASSLNAKGLIYLYKNDFRKALIFFTRSLKIREEIEDIKGVASTLNNIGYIYHSQKDYANALDYYNRSLKIREEIDDQQGIATSLVNIGEIYNAQENYNNALDFFSRSLKIFEETENQQGVATSLNNFGEVFRNQKDLGNALDYYLQSLNIREEIDDKQGKAASLISIGEIYMKQGNYQQAITYCRKGFSLAIDIGALLEQKESCTCLYEAYKFIGDEKKALGYHEQLFMIKDSLQANETSKQLLQMEFQKEILSDSLFQADKDRKIQFAHEQEVLANEKQRNVLVVSGLFVIFLAVGLWSRLSHVRKSKAELQTEKDRSDTLLLNILPEEIAIELKEKGRASSRDFELVSVLFTDFKSFTETSSKMNAQELVKEINIYFKAFDLIIEKYGIEKIKTIGDAYMAAGGLPIPSDDSVKYTVLAAIEMQHFIAERKMSMKKTDAVAFEMRAGIHTGPVVAGIVGLKKFQYDIWGDTVNTASRMESNGEVSKVNISENTYQLLKNDPQFTFEYRGKISAKGKGDIDMYFVDLNKALPG